MRFRSRELKDKGVKDLYNYCKRYNCAMISGERSEKSSEENERRTDNVRRFITRYGYDYIPTLGYWKGEGEEDFVRENSCFVIGSSEVYDRRFIVDIRALGKRYQQESVLFSFLTNLGPLAYYFYGNGDHQKVGEITADNIEDIIERWLMEKEGVGYSEIDRVKFVFDDVKKVNRHWGAKNEFHVSRRDVKMLFISNILFGTKTGDLSVDFLLEELRKEGEF